MDAIFGLIKEFFTPILDMGGPVIMLIILTVFGFTFWSEILQKRLKVVSTCHRSYWYRSYHRYANGAFSASLAKFVENTGIQLSITDVGWAPLATITWGSAWTLYFLLIMLIVNVVMLAMKKTDTLDVDIFDIWHLSITGLLINGMQTTTV